MSDYLPENVKAALITAGGCAHTFEPWKGCDTCGRPPAQWTRRQGAQVVDLAWQAVTIDGQTFEKKEVLSIDNIPKDQRDKVQKLSIVTDDPRYPMVHMTVDPRKARVHTFKRHSQKMSMGTGALGSKMTVLVLEIQTDPGDASKFVRLYLHPVQGPILSTEDSYF